jgi:hypothetical protein
MTSHEIEWLVVVGAVVLAAAATKYDVSPWRIFGLASLTTLVSVVLATRISDEQCGVSYRTSAGERLFDITMVSSLTLYAAAALAGVVDGIRLGKAGEREKAVSRAFGIPLVSAFGVGVLFFALLASFGDCLD